MVNVEQDQKKFQVNSSNWDIDLNNDDLFSEQLKHSKGKNIMIDFNLESSVFQQNHTQPPFGETSIHLISNQYKSLLDLLNNMHQLVQDFY